MSKHTPGPWIGFEIVERNELPAKVVYFKDQADAEREQKRVEEMTGGNIELFIQPLSLTMAAPELLEALKEALRYIEVETAYQGAMTAAQVEEAIKDEHFPSEVQIGASGVYNMARFDFVKTREVITRAEGRS